MNYSNYGPSVNPLAAGLANPQIGAPAGGGSPQGPGGSPSSGMPGGGASPMGGGAPSIPGLPPGMMPLPSAQPPPPITPTGVAQLPSAISAASAGVLPQQNQPFGFGTLGGGGGY
jgi:hypothetical protein